jgi:RNA polymerase sigma-70 factor (ECF subfamily)
LPSLIIWDGVNLRASIHPRGPDRYRIEGGFREGVLSTGRFRETIDEVIAKVEASYGIRASVVRKILVDDKPARFSTIQPIVDALVSDSNVCGLINLGFGDATTDKSPAISTQADESMVGIREQAEAPSPQQQRVWSDFVDFLLHGADGKSKVSENRLKSVELVPDPSSGPATSDAMDRIEPVTEQVMIERAKGGDCNAFDQLVAEHRAYLFAHISSVVRNRDDAEDIVAETLFRAHRNLQNFERRRHRSFRRWLVTISGACALERLESRRKQTVGLEPSEVRWSPEYDEGVTEEWMVTKALESLPERERIVINLLVREQKTVLEASAGLGITPGEVRVIQHHALRRMREELGRQGHWAERFSKFQGQQGRLSSDVRAKEVSHEWKILQTLNEEDGPLVRLVRRMPIDWTSAWPDPRGIARLLNDATRVAFEESYCLYDPRDPRWHQSPIAGRARDMAVSRKQTAGLGLVLLNRYLMVAMLSHGIDRDAWERRNVVGLRDILGLDPL